MDRSRGIGAIAAALLTVVLSLASAMAVRAEEGPRERFQAVMALYEEKLIPEAREAFTAILTDHDTPENRANIEFDSLLAGSLYYLGETFFLEDRFEEAATRYTEVIASFRTFGPESHYHLGLSRHYRQDYQGAIATFADLVSRYPGSPQAPQALYYQAVCHELLKDKAAAKAAYQTMIEKYPQHPWTKKAREKVVHLGDSHE